MAKTKMPSADELLAEVLGEKWQDPRIRKGQGRTVGIMRMRDIPFVWELKWDGGQFRLEVFHVRPRTLKLVADRYFNNPPEGE